MEDKGAFVHKFLSAPVLLAVLAAFAQGAACADKDVEEILGRMTLREKVGQCVNVPLSWIPLGSDAETAAWFARYPVGSVFMGRDLAGVYKGTLDKGSALARCAAATKVPLTVAGDLGPVTDPLLLPANGALGAVDDPRVAREYGRLVGRIGRANGFNWVFAPCVDVAYNWQNPIMACRTLGDRPERVAALSSEIVKGLQEVGLSACVKHYPGDGVDCRDQHLGPSVNSFTRTRWLESYGALYGRLFEEGCHSVMIGHISLPYLNPPTGAYGIPPPAVLSSAVSTGLLRREQRFAGVAVTDALIMGGFLLWPFDTPEKRSVAAFKAGSDVLLWPSLKTLDAMEEAVERGEIGMDRLDASVRRILEMKKKEGVLDAPFEKPSGVSEPLKAEAIAFSRRVIEREIALVRNDAALLPLDAKRTKRVLLWIADGSGQKTLTSYDTMRREFEKRGATVTVALNGNCLDFQKREKAGERYDAVFFLYDSRMHMIANAIRPVGAAGECLWTMTATDCHQAIPIAFSYPYLLQDAPWVKTLVNVHSDPDDIVQETLVGLLYGEKPFVGRSPYDLSVDLGAKD